MHLLIDGQALQTSSSRLRGIGRYASNLLRGLAVVRPSWRIEVVQNSALTPIAADNLHGLPVLSFQTPLPPHMDHCDINERYYADWLTAQGADAVMVPSFCEGWDAVLPSFCGPRPRLFAIVHDLIPLLYPEHYLTDLVARRWYAQRFRQLLGCDALMSNSEATACDVRTLGGAAAPPVVNIGGAGDPLFSPLLPSEFAARSREIRKRFSLQREFLLYVGAPDYRKNLQGAIRAFASLPEQCRANLDLAVVCRMKPAEREAVQNWANQAGVASALRLICSADDEDLRALYLMCRLFFFPSLYEGLGLPVLEALNCGAPVVTSDRSSLPEYAGPHSWLCDPTSPQVMAHVLQQALAEPLEARRHGRQQFARTYSWEKTADHACAVMERILKRRGNPVRRRRRLAWVVPLTRSSRPITEHVAESMPLLAERFDIEVIAASAPLEIPDKLARHHLILTAGEVPTRHAALPYDMFLYQLSPLPKHRELYDLLRWYPGLIVLRDFSLGDLRRLIESRVLPSQGEEAFASILGVLVDTAKARRLVRSATKIPVECFADTSAGWIEQAILRHEQSDGPWRSFAMRCLADRGEEADSILSSWAALRVQGQQHLASRRTELFSTRPESAAML
ncbi:MAG TPA: glycosyltransferase family 1 protein [Gemmataceae bacterium]|jgi:glycosyltransferase involved in cell wall biosynthesis